MTAWTHLVLKIDNGYFADDDREIFIDQDGEWRLELRPKFSPPAYDPEKQSGYLKPKKLKRLKILVDYLFEPPQGERILETGCDGPSYELQVYFPNQEVRGWSFYWSLAYTDWDAAFKELKELLFGETEEEAED